MRVPQRQRQHGHKYNAAANGLGAKVLQLGIRHDL
jgi:hypothetical protein